MNKRTSILPDAGVRPEVELLLACARARLDSDTTRRIQALLNEDLDWTYVTRKAYQQCVMPLLYSSLNSAGLKGVPQDVSDLLQNHVRAHVRNNLFLTRELVMLLELFDSCGIEAIPFKGPVLASTIYGSVTLRFYCDLDILVREQDVLRARRLLISRGYQIQDDFADEEKTARFLSKKKDYRFVRDEGRVIVELHWRITGKKFYFRPDMESLWHRLETESLGGVKVRAFPAEDLLLILCVHGAKHYFGRLEWICDVAEMVRARPHMNWERVLDQARELGSERMLFLGLFLARELLEAPLPEHVSRMVESDSTVRALAAQVGGLIFGENNAHPGLLEGNIYRIRLRERLRDKLRLGLFSSSSIFRFAVTPNEQDRAFLSLPGALSFFYYLLRPIRLARTYRSKSFKASRD